VNRSARDGSLHCRLRIKKLIAEKLFQMESIQATSDSQLAKCGTKLRRAVVEHTPSSSYGEKNAANSPYALLNLPPCLLAIRYGIVFS
jgi:hypothetical protein